MDYFHWQTKNIKQMVIKGEKVCFWKRQMLSGFCVYFFHTTQPDFQIFLCFKIFFKCKASKLL